MVGIGCVLEEPDVDAIAETDALRERERESVLAAYSILSSAARSRVVFWKYLVAARRVGLSIAQSGRKGGSPLS